MVPVKKLEDYKSRKFVLCSASLALFVVLLLLGKLSGDQFVDVYVWVIGFYLSGNIAYTWVRK